MSWSAPIEDDPRSRRSRTSARYFVPFALTAVPTLAPHFGQAVRSVGFVVFRRIALA